MEKDKVFVKQSRFAKQHTARGRKTMRPVTRGLGLALCATPLAAILVLALPIVPMPELATPQHKTGMMLKGCSPHINCQGKGDRLVALKYPAPSAMAQSTVFLAKLNRETGKYKYSGPMSHEEAQDYADDDPWVMVIYPWSSKYQEALESSPSERFALSQ